MSKVLRVRVSPDSLEAARARWGRGLAAEIKARIAAGAGGIDLSHRRHGQGGYRDARFPVRFNDEELASLVELRHTTGLAPGDLVCRVIDALAADL